MVQLKFLETKVPITDNSWSRFTYL